MSAPVAPHARIIHEFLMRLWALDASLGELIDSPERSYRPQHARSLIVMIDQHLREELRLISPEPEPEPEPEVDPAESYFDGTGGLCLCHDAQVCPDA